MERKDLKTYIFRTPELFSKGDNRNGKEFVMKDEADSVMDAMEARIKELEELVYELNDRNTQLKTYMIDYKEG